MKIVRKSLVAVQLCLLLTSMSACSDDETTPPVEEKKGLQTRVDANFGKVLTDAKGKTLYFFAKDSKGIASCAGACLANWPVYHNTDPSSDLGLDKSLIGEITREDGTKQSTYKGWPLYYYANDAATNDVKGDAFLKIWYVAKPDYLLMVANAQLIGADGKSYKDDYTEGQALTSYLTDGQGRTLYSFAPDKFNTNTFTKADFSNDAVWPIFQSNTGAIPSIVTKDQIAIITVYGKSQLTYKGWPLYYFGQDSKRGDNKGVSFPKPGVWPIVNEKTTTAPKA
ncbi:Secreted repeat of unknown function [Sphingobacterium nematocida]|uniref:Lipoprotein with Yx(FWY)xxD motif n=1 Tax=Sphingobacterium nematocida TaxID=1513896 RepID=A0A1T5CS66_9SPHI|nr:hypothetical protein [Sphingobacterium nematocida]SKB62173.1 Secreted repeat of unknown function [Sphingobacterium nematocida]